MTEDAELLSRYAADQSEDAFAELTRRHVDLVHSAALRLVNGDIHAAQDVTQQVFTEVARQAKRLARHPALVGWLYTTTRLMALRMNRTEQRRQAREQEAHMLNQLLHDDTPPVDWNRLRPVIEDAMHELDDRDRHAVLLRYFQNKTLNEVGAALNLTENAARMRVDRALDKLRGKLARHGITTTATALSVVVAANAVQAAPAGLAATISAAAVAGSAVQASTLIVATKTIVMTTLQKTIVATALAAAVGTGIYAVHQGAQLRGQIQSLEEQQAPMTAQIQQLQRERDAATKRAAALTEELASAKKNPAEVLKLRGEVGALRQEKAIAGSQSAINKITANPETRKALRDQQKMGMTALYADLAKSLSLTPDQKGQLNDLLADHVMDSIDLITQALHDKDTRGQIDQLFANQDSALQNQLQALIGADGLAQYQDYTKNLVSTVTAAQFAASLAGDPATVADKKSQLTQAMQQATQSALAAAGLPADYQTIPMLNFANIASEEQAAQSLQLLDSIYAQVAANASTFLSADELNKFQEYRTNAIKTSQTMLLVNRKMMAPISQ
jgi:RNA polymerase sigma factor (sigma-70 family)